MLNSICGLDARCPQPVALPAQLIMTIKHVSRHWQLSLKERMAPVENQEVQLLSASGGKSRSLQTALTAHPGARPGLAALPGPSVSLRVAVTVLI